MKNAYHEGEWQWEEDGYTVTRTYHYSPPGCHSSCGILFFEKDGKVERVEGDPLDSCSNGKLCIRPGTDAALACAWLNVIINEKLYDQEYIDYWCAGLDELAESVKDKTPAWAAEICDLTEEEIIASAKPGAIQWGLAFDQQLSAMALCLAGCDLMAICGNVDVPGGNILVHNAFEINAGYATGDDIAPAEWRAKKLNATYSLNNEGADFVAHATSDGILQAMETGYPYPIKMVWIQSSNALSYPDIDAARTWWAPCRTMVKVTDYYEAKSDEEIILAVGKRLNPEVFDK